MGLSNFFDNFLSGMAFGMFAGNPFYGGWGGYGGGYNTNIVDFGTFANGFPKVFDDNLTMSAMSQPSVFTTFANSFPTAPDFSNVAKTIWDYVTDPNSEFNKRMKAYYENSNKATSQYNNSINIPYTEMPFSPYYLPLQTSLPQNYQNWFMGNYTGAYSQIQTMQNASAKITEPAMQSIGSKVMEKAPGKQRLSSKSTKEKTEKQNRTTTPYSYNENALKERWKKKTSDFPDKFFTRVIEISKSINCRPDDLMAVMNLESSGFKLNAVNPISGATGLIQFMPSTARGLGTSTEAIAKMSALEQLNFVEKYLKSQKRNAGYPDGYSLNSGELYAIVFRPKYARKNYLAKSGEKAYADNKGLDKNGDGYITKADLASKLREFMA